ncbi:MAG: prepilin peptidase [Candidatus Omnitrophica bacterium]|nr:prepilin peptidase [Candidatus Omnitrophota bacterium]
MIIDPINFSSQLLVLLLGLVTSYTDITEKKIKNVHLIVIGAAAVALGLMQAPPHPASAPDTFVNVLVASAIGIPLFISRMWRGGDVKLFIVYSLLMPATGQEGVFLASPVVLFISSFLAALMIVLPFEIYEVFWTNRLSLKSKEIYWDNIKLAFLGFASFNWIIFSFFYKLKFFKYPLVVAVFSVLLFPFLNRWVMKWAQNALGHWRNIIMLAVMAGFIIHLLFIPREFFWTELGRSVRSIFIFSTIFFIFKCAIDKANVSKERMPFAPMLMIGYYASYTGFLKKVASLIMWMR